LHNNYNTKNAIWPCSIFFLQSDGLLKRAIAAMLAEKKSCKQVFGRDRSSHAEESFFGPFSCMFITLMDTKDVPL
jgi:hypothetical protein